MPRVNEEINPSLETGTATYSVGYAAPGLTVTSILRSNSNPADSATYYGYVNITGGDNARVVTVHVDSRPVTAGATYVFTGATRTSGFENQQTRLGVDWLDSAGNQLISNGVTNAPYVSASGDTSGVWTRHVLQANAPAGAAQARRTLWCIMSVAATRTFRWDALNFERAATFDPAVPYFDGDSAGARWDGTPHASTSRIPGPAVIATGAPVAVRAGVVAGSTRKRITVDGAPVAPRAQLAVGRAQRLPTAIGAPVGLATAVARGSVRRTVSGRPVAATAAPVASGPLRRTTSGSAVLTTTTLLLGRTGNLFGAAVAVRVGVIAGVLEVRRITPLQPYTAPVVARPRQGVRFIAQRVLDRRFVDWDLPLRDPVISWKLNAATEMTAMIAARDLYHAELDEWAHYIHAERDGQIIASAMLMPWSPGGEDIEINAAGVTRYAHGLPYQGNFAMKGAGGYVGQQLDPLDVVRHIWAHLQSYPDGKIGVILPLNKSDVRIGTPERNVSFETAAGDVVNFDSGPYLLKWWEETDCGREIDELAEQTPFDYREAPRWNAARTDVEQRVELGWPRLGRGRDDLAFVEGENLTVALTPVEDDARYASEVIFLGRGEGIARVRGRYGQREGARVRRAVVVQGKDVATPARAASKARTEWGLRRGWLEFDEAHLKPTHPNAPLGSFAVGDDVPVRAAVDGVGRVLIRHRVMATTWTPDSSDLEVSMKRSDSFTYAPPPER